MTPQAFRRWVRRMCEARGLTAQDVAAAIGISFSLLKYYQTGQTENGAPRPVPRKVRLAMAAFELGFDDFDAERPACELIRRQIRELTQA